MGHTECAHDGLAAAVPRFNDEGGYVRCEVTPQTWRTDFRTVPYVTRRGAPVSTRASFVVESGRPVLQQA